MEVIDLTDDHDSGYHSTLTQAVSSASNETVDQVASTTQLRSPGLTNGYEHARYHKWTDMQRYVLVILWRFYDRKSLQLFTRIFNSVTGLELSSGKLPVQFSNGGYKMNRTKEAVYNVPFHDPRGLFNAFHALIEQHAEKAGIYLQRRTTDDIPSTLQATITASAKSASSHIVLGGLSGSSRPTRKARDWSVLPHSPAISVDTTPHLGFRVWDSNSWTVLKPEGFVAKLFVDRNGGVTKPLAPDDPSELFAPLVLAHLSLVGGASCFVSIVTSFVQLLRYASNKSDDAQIAVIDLAHLSLRAENKCHRGADVTRMLRAGGEMRWSRYRGECEILVWGDICRDAIINIFPISLLHGLAAEEIDVANFLNLKYFDGHSSTRSIAQALRKEKKILNQEAAAAMGKVSHLLFGNCKSTVNFSLRHVTTVVALLVDGWTLSTSDHSEGTLQEIASNFAAAFGSGLVLRDVMLAFLDGVEIGRSGYVQP